jgi:protein-tyrosine phosphatase
MEVTEIESNRRFIHLQGGVNFRDLGGYSGAGGRTVRWNLIFRAGTTHRLTEQDRDCLRDIGIRTVVDLRSNRERLASPHGLAEQRDILYWANDHERTGGVLSLMLKDPDIEPAQMRAAMIRLYEELPYQLGEIYQELFRKLISAPLPLVFNCAAGKDRTGVAAALILLALGVSWTDIIADYMLSARSTADIRAIFRWSETDVQGRYNPDAVDAVFGVNVAYLEAMHQGLLQRSGSIENYFQSNLALNAAALASLRQRFLS